MRMALLLSILSSCSVSRLAYWLVRRWRALGFMPLAVSRGMREMSLLLKACCTVSLLRWCSREISVLMWRLDSFRGDQSPPRSISWKENTRRSLFGFGGVSALSGICEGFLRWRFWSFFLDGTIVVLFGEG